MPKQRTRQSALGKREMCSEKCTIYNTWSFTS